MATSSWGSTNTTTSLAYPGTTTYQSGPTRWSGTGSSSSGTSLSGAGTGAALQSGGLLGGTNVPDLFTGQQPPYLPQIMYPLPDVNAAYEQFQTFFPQPQKSYLSQAQSIVAGLPKPPTIVAPQIAPVTVAFPEGGYDQLQASLYNSQFLPVQREIERRAEIERQQLAGQLAQVGLSESGAGVGQIANLERETSEQLGAASAAISDAATAKALEAQLTVATQQANIDIQKNLAQSQLDYAAQADNARNILERGALEGQILTTALGLDAQTTDNIRGQFLTYLNIQTQAALQQSEIARQSLADIFNAVLTSAATQQRAQQYVQPQQVGGGMQEAQVQPFTLPSAFAVGLPGYYGGAGTFTANITPQQYAAATGIAPYPQVSGGGDGQTFADSYTRSALGLPPVSIGGIGGV